jgi:hypothetical protein
LYVCIENTRARSLLVLSFFLSFETNEPSNLSRKKRRIPREKEKNKHEYGRHELKSAFHFFERWRSELILRRRENDRERFERDEQRRRRAATPFERFFPAKSKTNDEYYDSRKWRFERD